MESALIFLLKSLTSNSILIKQTFLEEVVNMADMLAIVKTENGLYKTIVDVVDISEKDIVCDTKIECLDAFNTLFKIEKIYSKP